MRNIYKTKNQNLRESSETTGPAVFNLYCVYRLYLILFKVYESDGETQGARQDTKLTAQDYIENLMVDFLYVFIVSFTLQTV